VTRAGASWILVDELEEQGCPATPTIELVRSHPAASLRYEGGLTPRVSFKHPDRTSIRFTWPNIKSFEADDEGINGLFRSWVA